MSFFLGKDPAAGDKYQCDAIKSVIVPRTADLGDGFTVRQIGRASCRERV